MPTPFVGASLSLESVVQTNAVTVRARFTNYPLTVDSTGIHDALNVSNYALSGPGINAVASAVAVSGDPQSVDLYLPVPLLAGSWTLTVTNIQTPEGNVLVQPTSIQFTALKLDTQPPLSGGAEQDDQERRLRAQLSPAFKGKAWDALIAALATGDKYRDDVAASAFDQLFKSTATGVYLDRRTANDGFGRPGGIGIDNEVFRKLAIKTTARKQVIQVILESLEAFYGSEATRASSTTTVNEPYILKDGDQLIVDVEGEETVVTFNRSDFAQMGAARAIEVAAVITRTLRQGRRQAYALAITDPSSGSTTLRIYSGAIGLRGSVTVRGGRGQNAFKFPTEIHPPSGGVGPAAGTTWNVVVGTGSNGVPAGGVRFSFVSGTDPDLIDVNVGDYVNVFGAGFDAANRGAFPVVAVTASGFDVLNLVGVSQTGVAQVLADDVKFFTPTRRTVQSTGRMATATQGDPSTLDVILPATTQAVSRSVNTGAYLHSPASAAITVASRNTSGLVTVTAPSHGIPVDASTHQAYVDGLVPVVSAAPASTWTDCDAGGLAILGTGSASAQLNDGRILMSGGSGTGTACSIYDPASNTLSSVANMLVSRTGHTLTTLTNGKVLAAGGDAGGTAELYDPTSNTWTSTGAMNGVHLFGAGVLLPNGKVLVAGGGNTVQDEIYDPVTAQWSQTGTALGLDHNFGILTRDGLALFGGGYTGGTTTPQATVQRYNYVNGSYRGSTLNTARGQALATLLSQGTSGEVVVLGGDIGGGTGTISVEIYNPATNSWSVGPSLSIVRNYPGLTTLLDGRLLVVGGSASATATEIYDPGFNSWSTDAATAVTGLTNGQAFTLPNGKVFLCHTGHHAELWSRTFGSAGGSINGIQRVLATDTNTLTFTTLDCLKATTFNCAAATVTWCGGNTNKNIGPFLLDPIGSSPSVTGIETTCSDSLVQGTNATVMNVVDASKFPDQPGYICFGWATSNQLSPVRYLGRVSNSELLLDPSYTFPATIAPGTTVTLLVDRSPYIPADATKTGSFYVTGASAGRVAAEATIDDLVAAGVNVNKIVVYPSDIGLGNEGQPAGGTAKISDKVVVWGGDDLDTEIDTARSD